MKKLIRLTESDLHKVIKESVKKIIKEYHGEPDDSIALIYNGIIEDYKAQEIAEEYGLSEEEAAAEWFKDVAADGEFEENQMPHHRQFVMEIPEVGSEMYKDYGAGYYFLVKKGEAMKMKVGESVIKEDGGATNCAGAMQTGSGNAPLGTNPESGQYTVPFGKVQRRKIYQPKDKNAGGDVTKQSSNVDMTPAMNRKDGKGGSISIPKNRK